MTTKTCTTCGGELLTSNGQTFCPACLLQQGMKSSTYGGGPRVAWKPPEIEQLTAAFPQLEIQQLLGVGGMGAVFKVRQKELDRIAALKVLPGEMAADAGFTERFLREARLLASLSHPHIVTVYEFGQRDGIYFLLMEFIDGVTLRQALRAEPIKKLGSKETLAIVGQLCDALQFAHDEGVVHRDIKPENILIDKRGRVKIADFGLARLLGQSPTMPTLTRTHQLMGTPAYMAPEQIEGLPGIDHRADIYSMGVVFYELLTGELPLGRFSPPSERAETDVRLDEVVLRTLAREPDRRYQQASQVKTDVEALRGPALASLSSTTALAKKRRVGPFVTAFALGALMPAFLYLVMMSVMQWQLAESNAVPQVANNPIAFFAAQEPSIVAQRSTVDELSAPSSDGSAGMMRGAGRDEMMGMGGMPGDMGSAMSSNLFHPGSAIVFENSVPSLNPQLFNLTDEQRAAVNTILKETHERYIKEEALHSIVSVDANGVQTTEISAFPDQLRAIENEMWTKLDDAVPVETQVGLRNQLILFARNSATSRKGMGLPGILGWAPSDMPRKIQIAPSGKWFEWLIDFRMTRLTHKGQSLPPMLQRFYREPGPWMAVGNVRATYAAKDWMKLADHFTAEAMIREFLNAKAFGDAMETRIENDDSATEEWATKYSQQYMEAVARSPELSEVSGQVISTPEIDLLHLTAPSDIDAALANGVKDMPEDSYRKAFALWGLTSAVLDNDEFEFELGQGDVSSYTATGDTASATLTIPNKPPVPIRFKRENGQWKIDAIGSNERLLERLKQTKTWKQHAEIEAVLENARTAYATKEWQKLADCFTRTGKCRWALRTYSKLPQEDGGLPFLEDRKDWRVNFDQFLNCPANESDAVLITLIESLPDDLINLMVTATAVQSSGQPKEVFRFEFDGVRIADLNVVADIATAKLGGTADMPPVPVRFVQHVGQWKIDAIGRPDELQQQVLKSLQRQHGASPRAAVEAFRKAMADGRFQAALNCMTEDARNEWLGEMLIGYVSNPNAGNLGNTAVRFSIDEVGAIQTATDVNLEFLSNRLKKDPRRSDRTVSPADRRKVAIEAGVPVGDFATRISTNMVLAFLNARFQTRPKMLDTQMLGEFQEIPFDRDGPEVMKYLLQPASRDQPPLELDIIQINGLWKLNTIIDPALKPWPLPAEEPAPPAEATPVDGATGVP